VVLSILLAPVTMVTQTKALAGLVIGVPSGWNTQAREARRLPLRDLLPSLREHLVLGALFAATFFYSVNLALWLSPLALGLLLSPWLISLTSSEDLGAAAGHAGLFAVPRPEIADPTAPSE
jgi:membrane glycosyltransferase